MHLHFAWKALSWAAAFLTLVGATAPGASAKDGRDQESQKPLSIVLSGSITARCSIGGGEIIALGELTGRDRASADFDLSCNVPFDLIATSGSGGIVHERRPEGEGPFKGTIPYKLGVSISGSAPQAVVLQNEFSSAEMVDGGVLSSGNSVAFGGGVIFIQGQLPAGQELLAGQYHDSITIVINPRV